MKRVTRLLVAMAFLGVGAPARAQSLSGYNTAASEASKSAERLGSPRFYGFTFDLTTGDSSGLNSVGHNYRNDFVWYFEPAWNLGQLYLRDTRWKYLQLQARFSLSANASGTDEANFAGQSNAAPAGTCPGTSINDSGSVDPGSVGYCNPNANKRRADYSDLWLTLRSPRVYTIPKIDVVVNPALRVVLPTSLESQFQTMIMSLTPTISVGRTFWRDKLRLGYGFGFTKYFHRQISPLLDPQSGGAAATAGGNLSDGPFGAGLSNFYLDPSREGTIGGYNVSYSFIHTISGGIQLSDKWSFDVIYLVIDSFTYGHSCATNNVDIGGTLYDTCSSGDRVAANSGATLARPSHRDSQVFWATLGYQPVDWLGISLAWINWAPMQMPDSSYRQGIISTNYDEFTTIQLAATITLDKLAARYWRKQ